jgi:sugar/nucleoside kinase (ribokinase family)
MTGQKQSKVIGVGSPILDILIKVDDSFIEKKAGGGKGGSRMLSSLEFDNILSSSTSDRKISPGGSSANTIFGLAHLGIKTDFLGTVGDDDNGDFYRKKYENIGGGISKIRVNKTHPTGRCLCMISPDSQRTMRTDLGAATTLSPNEISKADFSDCTHMHMEGYMLFNGGLATKILDCAKSSDCVISLDLSSFEVVNACGNLKELLREYVDIVFANEDEAKAFSGGADPESALLPLSELCEISVVKLGKNGAMIKRGNEISKIKALNVKAVDTTGAGDLWATGFLYGLLSGKSLLAAGDCGSLLGAEVVKILGVNIPTNKWTILSEKLRKIS